MIAIDVLSVRHKARCLNISGDKVAIIKDRKGSTKNLNRIERGQR